MYTENENDGVNIQTEIFALGCTLYELWTTRELYADLDGEEVRDHYLQGCFPMWKASQVDQLFRSVGTATLQPHKSCFIDLRLNCAFFSVKPRRSLVDNT